MAQAYKVDFTTRTITITAEFEKAMKNPEAAEDKIIRRAACGFPRYADCQAHAPHTDALHQQERRKERRAIPDKNLTYEKMERFTDEVSPTARRISQAV
ncbi:MAG: hypothetical protein V8S92_04500 [Oscillospiraceae bacterium]